MAAVLYFPVCKNSDGRPESSSASNSKKKCNLRRTENCTSFGLINSFFEHILCTKLVPLNSSFNLLVSNFALNKPLRN